jgi:hypothetical protein
VRLSTHKSLLGMAVAAAVAVGAGGCFDSASLGAFNVVDARTPAQGEVDIARKRASERYLKASDRVAVALQQARRAAAQGEREIALAQARASYAAAISQCDSTHGEIRRACHTQAQAKYSQARVAARQIEYAYLH